MAYSCVIDAVPLLLYQNLIWAVTLTQLVGLSSDDLVVHAIRGTDPSHLQLLRSLGIRVVTVAPFDHRNLFSNKLRQLTSASLADADVAVLCDCDLAFCADITAYTGGAGVGAKVVDGGHPRYHVWRHLAHSAGLSDRLSMARAAQTLRWTCRQNLNGGLLIVPRRFLGPLSVAWPRWFDWVLTHAREFGPKITQHADQVSFGLAAAQLELPIDELPLALNFSTMRAHTAPSETVPLVLHYHRRLTSAGRISPTGIANVDLAISRVNRLLDMPDNRALMRETLHRWQADPSRRFAARRGLVADRTISAGSGEPQVP